MIIPFGPSRFKGNLVLTLTAGRTPVGDPIYRVDEPLSYSPNKGEAIVVPTGFMTDLASIPKDKRSQLAAPSFYTKAAVLHDYLYVNHITTRRRADALFLEAMTNLGMPLKGRLAMWLAVRVFGRKAWNQRLGWAP